MVARCTAAASVPSTNFMLWNTLEKGQVKHLTRNKIGFEKQVLKPVCFISIVLNSFWIIPGRTPGRQRHGTKGSIEKEHL